MHADASRWFADHTWHEPRWSVADLVRAKGSRSISVALPALNEAKTVAGVVGIVMPLVGLFETPKPLPGSILESVTGPGKQVGSSGMPAGAAAAPPTKG